MAQFDFAVVTTGEFRDWLVSGFLLSLRLTAITWILSLPIATATALCRLSSVTALRWLGAVFVESIRNVPLLVSTTCGMCFACRVPSSGTVIW